MRSATIMSGPYNRAKTFFVAPGLRAGRSWSLYRMRKAPGTETGRYKDTWVQDAEHRL